MSHLPVLPILIPMLGATISLLVEHHRHGRVLRRIVAWTAMTALLLAVLALYWRCSDGQVQVYLLGDWPARLGIALLADRLTTWMLLVTTLLAIPCLLQACAGWDRRAPHFHTLFQFQLMGLNGAFLTADLFNLFVFFEVMLIASYGLLLSGSRQRRLRAGLHYVVFNVAASSLMLIALGLIYGQLGALNLATLAQRIAAVPAAELPLLQASLGLLLLVFCAKAALLPLYLWLPETYARAPAAVAALFVILTKVGLYALLRLSSLWFSDTALDGFARVPLRCAGLATLLLAALGVLAADRLRVLVAYLVIVSAATLFVAFSLGVPGAVAAGLYYLAHSCFVTAALFLIADLIRRRRGDASDRKQRLAALPDRALPGTLFLIAAVAVAGLPPLSGFLSKAALLQQVPAALLTPVWGGLLLSGLLVMIALTRAGIRLFWRLPAVPAALAPTRPAPSRPLETAATVLLLGYLLAMTLAAAPLLRQTEAIAAQLQRSAEYLRPLLDQSPQRRAP